MCDRLDNSRFTYLDATPATYGTWSKDAATGIISFTYAGTATPITWRLGVSGTGTVGVGGTFSTFNTVTNEYVNPSTTGATQADSACGDPAKGEPNDGITWYASVAALLAVEGANGLQKVTRVRGDYASLPAGTTVISTYPQQTNVTYSYGGTDNAPGKAFVAGTSTIGAMGVNQAMWQSNNASVGTAGIVKDSDAVKIFFNEFIQVSMASSSNPIPNSSVAAGSLVGFNVTVNATSTSNNHVSNVDVWVVMPNLTSYVAGSSTLGGVALPDPVCTNTGLPTALFPAATQPLAAGFSACHWVLPNQPITRATVGDVAANLPVLKFNQLVSSTAPSGTQLFTSSFASSTSNAKYLAIYGGGQPSPAATPAAAATKGFGCDQYFPCSTSSWTLSASTTSGLLLSKQVDKGAIFANNGFSYSLNYSTNGAPLDGVRLLDVLPYNGDARGTNYAGTLILSAPLATPVIGGLGTASDPTLVVRYTNNLPANISRDPYAASQNLTGTGTNSLTSSNWCTTAQFGLPGCPITIADATAFMAFPMFTSAPSGRLVAGNTYSLIVPVLSAGNLINNVYSNNFIGDSPSLQARMPGSNAVSTTVVPPDLTLSKTIVGVCVGVACVPSAYVAGQVIPANAKIRYQLAYSNNSYTVAQTNVVLSDVLPIVTAAAAVSNVVIVSGAIAAPTAATLAGLAAGGATLSFPTLASLAARAVGVITLDVQTNAPAGSSITNKANILSSQDPLGVSSSVTVDVPNLLLSKTTSTAKVAQGGIATYTITVQNASTSPVTALQVYDFLPFAGTTLNAGSQFNYVLASAIFTGGLPAATVAITSVAPTIAPYSSNVNQQQVVWNFGVFSLAAGGSVTLTFNASVPTAMPFAIYGNSAAVSYSVAGVVKKVSLDGAASVEVLNAPSITLLKVVQVFSDPVNGTTNPKFIPGAQALYTITASNAGGVTDLNSLTITDPLPANTALYVNDLGVAGSGPIAFTQGAASSGLTYTYSAVTPANATDDVEFFGGAAPGSWTYIPVAGADGCDPLVSNWRVKPKGIFLGNSAAPNPSFSLQFRVCVR